MGTKLQNKAINKRDTVTGCFRRQDFFLRLINRINVKGPNECWPWSGAKNRGYGVIKKNGKTVYVNVAVYEAFVGPMTKGNQIHHRCRNRGCANYSHLESVTPKVHIRLDGNNACAVNAVKTHCIWGHEFTLKNTMFRGEKRRCRKCHNLQSAKAYKKQKSKQI